MKQLLTIALAFAFAACADTSDPDLKPDDVYFKEIPGTQEAVQWTHMTLGGNNFPGTLGDYELTIGNNDAVVTKITSNDLTFFVPENVNGINDVNLFYKGTKFKIATLNVKTPAEALPMGTAIINTGDQEFPYMIIDEERNVISPHLNESRLVDYIEITNQNETTSIGLNDQGLIETIRFGNETLIFGGYNIESGTVNIARVTGENFHTPDIIFDVHLGKELLTSMTNLRENSGGRRADIDWSGFLDGVGMALQGVSCVTSIAAWTNPMTWPYAVARLGSLYQCGQLAWDIYKKAYPDQPGQPTIPEAMSVSHAFGATVYGAMGCAKIANLPRNPQGLVEPVELFNAFQDCKGAVLSIAKEALTEDGAFFQFAVLLMDQVKAILNSGYGDIKITLGWDTNNTDIDLHVQDPKGETIYYGSPQSSSGGVLDVDDVDGLGPENIFWPKNSAPLGSYNVSVHYYGPSDGPPTNFWVTVYNFGKSKTFTGTVTFDQHVAVVSFEAGVEWGRVPSGGRGANFTPHQFQRDKHN